MRASPEAELASRSMAPRRRGRRAWTARGRGLGLKLAGVVVTLAVMELCSRLGVLPQRWFPPVSQIYQELGQWKVKTDRASIELIGGIMKKIGLIKADIDYDKAILA